MVGWMSVFTDCQGIFHSIEIFAIHFTLCMICSALGMDECEDRHRKLSADRFTFFIDWRESLCVSRSIFAWIMAHRSFRLVTTTARQHTDQPKSPLYPTNMQVVQRQFYLIPVADSKFNVYRPRHASHSARTMTNNHFSLSNKNKSEFICVVTAFPIPIYIQIIFCVVKSITNLLFQ